MEKFQKYCFGVLLVIIYSNISVQAGKETLQHEDCREFYQLCSQIQESGIKSQTPAETGDISLPRFKENRIPLTFNIFSAKKQNNFYKNTSGADFSQKEKYDYLLKSFETKTKENGFARILYFKTKVSKVRNKDYLSAIG